MKYKNKETGEVKHERILEEEYDDFLDEIYEEINICGHTYSPSISLYRVDEVAYHQGFLEYLDVNEWEENI